LLEVQKAAEIVGRTADPDANMIFGAVIDETIGTELRMTVIATGFDPSKKARRLRPGWDEKQQPGRKWDEEDPPPAKPREDWLDLPPALRRGGRGVADNGGILPMEAGWAGPRDAGA